MNLPMIALVALCAALPMTAWALPGAVAVEPAQVQPGQAARILYQPPSAIWSRRVRDDVFVHYGFNGWNLPVSHPGAGTETDTGNLNHFVRQRMEWDPARQRYAADVQVPVMARALHAVFCWDACGGGQWDNNGRRDYAWPMVFPYIGPLLTWNETTDPARGVVITFEHPVPVAGWVTYRREGAAAQRVDSPPATMHRIVLDGLEPGSTYRYQVGVEGGFVSAEYRFKTVGVEQDATSFVVIGDAQDNGENGRFADIARAVLDDHDDVDLVVSTGDLPWNDKPGDWWSFFDKGKALLASKVFMPALGNHDTPTPSSHPDHGSFLHYFSLPEVLAPDRVFYRQRLGNAVFYVMNSERPLEMTPGGAQYEWLARHLSRQGQDGADWTFVLWHVPPYNAGARHWRSQYQFRPLTSLFSGVVDWQFSGHEHLGQRFKPLRFSANGPPRTMPVYGTDPDGGVGHLIVPGAGVTPESRLVSSQDAADLRDLLAYPVVPAGSDRVTPTNGFARVDIDGNQLQVRIFATDQRDLESAPLAEDHVIYVK